MNCALERKSCPAMLAAMAAVSYQQIKAQLRELYAQDHHPWLVRPATAGGDKDSTMVLSLVFDAILSIPPSQRKKPVAIFCNDTRVEIQAVAEGVESTLKRMRRCSPQHNPNIEVQLLKPPVGQSSLGPLWIETSTPGYGNSRSGYLRGIQCILLATGGLVSPNPDFISGAFGETFEKVLEILTMPDRYIIYRSHYANHGAADWQKEYRRLGSEQKMLLFDMLAELNAAPRERPARIAPLETAFRPIIEHYYPGGKTAPKTPEEEELAQQGVSVGYDSGPG